MKILLHTTDRAEIQTVRMKLESKGIPIYVGSENIGPALGVIISDKFTIWVCIDEQLQDAVSVLNNEEHEVLNPVDVEGYYKFIEEKSSEIANKNYNRIMLFIVLSFITGYIYWVYSNGTFT